MGSVGQAGTQGLPVGGARPSTRGGEVGLPGSLPSGPTCGPSRELLQPSLFAPVSPAPPAAAASCLAATSLTQKPVSRLLPPQKLGFQPFSFPELLKVPASSLGPRLSPRVRTHGVWSLPLTIPSHPSVPRTQFFPSKYVGGSHLPACLVGAPVWSPRPTPGPAASAPSREPSPGVPGGPGLSETRESSRTQDFPG